MKSYSIRVAFAAAAVALAAGMAVAQGISEPGGPAPNPSTPPANPTPPAGRSDKISAAIVLRELRQLGVAADVSADSRGEPRIEATVDKYKWAIFFYGCDKDGALEQRNCGSLQFFSGYTMNSPISALTMNKFNSENRYIRAYTAITGQTFAARISMDVMFSGTDGDPARIFRSYFAMMKFQTTEFRKLINFN